MPRQNRTMPNIFQRMEQSNEARMLNVDRADRANIEMIPLEDLRGTLNTTLNQEFLIPRGLLEGVDVADLEQRITADMVRRMDEVMVSGNGRPFLSNGDMFSHPGGTVTGRMSSNDNHPKMHVGGMPRIDMSAARKSMDKLRESFATLGKHKIVLDPGLPPDFAAWLDDKGEPVQVGETHTSPESTEGFALPWVQGPQPERIGKDGKPVGKQRSDNSYVLQEGKRIYAYVENEHGQRVRQFIAQTNGPRVAQYIIDACNAYANEANTMGQNSAVIAANLRRELQEVKLVNSQDRTRFQRELNNQHNQMVGRARDHEAKIKDMQRQIDQANAAKKVVEQQRDEARQALEERKQKTLEEFKPTDTLAGRRIRLRKGGSDELA